MAIKTDEDLLTVFLPIIEEVSDAIMERAKKLLQQHINADTYRIGKNNMGKPKINDYYLDGSGTPSYEFRDVAWDTKQVKHMVDTVIASIFYDGDKLSHPTENSPYLHGNYHKDIDRTDSLASILNVSGIAGDADFTTNKKREPFWDNFEKEFGEKIGEWLYTEFNNRGISIPALKIFKAGM